MNNSIEKMKRIVSYFESQTSALGFARHATFPGEKIGHASDESTANGEYAMAPKTEMPVKRNFNYLTIQDAVCVED